MKKNESFRIHKKLFTVSAVFAVGFVFLNRLEKISENFYNSKKNNLEENLGLNINKKVELGNFAGLSFLGFSLDDSKIIENGIDESKIEANNIIIRIMPLRSFLGRKWIFNIDARKLDINLQKDFFKIGKRNFDQKGVAEKRFNYEFYFNLRNKSNIKIYDLGIDSKIKGNLVYRSQENQLIGSVSTYLKNQGILNFEFNKKFNDEFLKFRIISKGVNLNNLKYNIFDTTVNVKNGFLKSNLSFYSSADKKYCKGKLSFYDLDLFSNKLNQNIKAPLLGVNCKKNIISTDINELNYGTLISNIKLNIPLENNINNINIDGKLGYINSINPEIRFLGNIPFGFKKSRLIFGNLDSRFDLNRTQLSNLNIFRNNGISGFITAKGTITGQLNDLKTAINFNVDYPNYNGIRFREIWDGKIINQSKGYLLKMNNRYSPIPSFLSIKVDSNLKLENLEFSRLFDSNEGDFNIIRKNNTYKWKANNFPLNELELSLQNNDFDRIDGTINGSGLIDTKKSTFNGRFSLSLGKYKNIKLANSLFDFSFKENSLRINSSLFPIDGGMIDLIYKSKSKQFVSVDFINISADWTSLTLLDIFNLNKNKIKSDGTSKDLKFIEISTIQKTIDEQLDFLKNSITSKVISINEKRINKFLEKFEGRYNSSIDIYGNNVSNYKIKSNLNGYLKEKNNPNNSAKNSFSMDLNGGLFRNNGLLKISNLPLNLANLFFIKPKDFKGNLDINLVYNLTDQEFFSVISSNKTSINDFSIMLDKTFISYKDSLFNVDMSLWLDKSVESVSLIGNIPINKGNEIDLKLKGNQRFLELIGNLSNENFTFKNGDANLRMLIKGELAKPIANGFLFIKNGEVDILNNNLNNIDATLIFDFDQVEIKNFNASTNEIGKIFIGGSLPFYKGLDDNEKSINFISKSFQLVGKNIDFEFDSNIFIKGSLSRPFISGNVGIKNGYINFKTVNENNSNTTKVNNRVDYNKTWPELYWSRDKEIEIISNESILNRNLFEENLPQFLGNITFDNLYVKLGQDFRVEYGTILKAYLETRVDVNLNGNIKNNLNARGLVDIEKGRANLYTTPFKLDKNLDNYILFASRNGITPYLDFSLVSKVPDTIIPISQNNRDFNITDNLNALDNTNSFNAFGIGNTRFIKIEASYKGFLDQLSFEDENQMIKLRSTPSYTRSQIIGLIGGNSANLINRAFISQLNGADGITEKLQLSLYPALIVSSEKANNIFSSENLGINEKQDNSQNQGTSSQAWIAEIGLDINDSLNFAMQTTPDRDDIPPLWILTLQANEFLEILGSFDSKGDWKSQVQLFFRY